MSLIQIDGSYGEGGGQVLRSSLALSLVTGRPFRIDDIRRGRKKPGLMRQHLTAVRAAAEVGRAEVQGDDIGSERLSFAPQTIHSGRYQFAVGTAGSCTLVLQTVLPALILARGDSELILEGGTHNPFAPPFHFLKKAFLPLINRMGPRVSARLERAGFYPAGGGRFTVDISPVQRLRPLELLHRGKVRSRIARGLVSRLPRRIAVNEVRAVCEVLGWERDCCRVEEVSDSRGPGNLVTVEIESEQVTEVFTGFGRRGVPAEEVGRAAAREAGAYLDSGAPVGPYLADQLMVPLSLAGRGRFRTTPLSSHFVTNMEVVRRFLDLDWTVTPIKNEVMEVSVG